MSSSYTPLTDNFFWLWLELKVKYPRSLEISKAKRATRQAIEKFSIELDSIMTKYNLHEKTPSDIQYIEKSLSTDKIKCHVRIDFLFRKLGYCTFY